MNESVQWLLKLSAALRIKTKSFQRSEEVRREISRKRDSVYFCFLKNTFYGSIIALRCCWLLLHSKNEAAVCAHMSPLFLDFLSTQVTRESSEGALKELLRQCAQLMPSICWIYVWRKEQKRLWRGSVSWLLSGGWALCPDSLGEGVGFGGGSRRWLL